MAQFIAVASLITTVAGTAASIHQSNVAQRREERAQRIKQRQQAEANNRRIRQALADARAAQAGIVNAGFAQTGGFTSSGIAGGIGAAQTQAAANVGFARQTQAATSAIGNQLQASNRARSNANTFGAVSQLSSQFGRTIGGDFNSIFNQAPKQPTTPIGG
jgi:hypothetical protein